MPKKDSAKPIKIWILDIRGLLAWVSLSGNERSIVDGLWENEQIYVCNRVWREFVDAYPEHKDGLPVGPGVKVNDEQRQAATSIAELAQTNGVAIAYDAVDFYVAGIASIEGYCVVSTGKKVSAFYDKVNVRAVTFAEVLAATN